MRRRRRTRTRHRGAVRGADDVHAEPELAFLVLVLILRQAGQGDIVLRDDLAPGLSLRIRAPRAVPERPRAILAKEEIKRLRQRAFSRRSEQLAHNLALVVLDNQHLI